MKKNLLRLMLTLAMVLSLFTGMTVTASAKGGGHPGGNQGSSVPAVNPVIELTFDGSDIPPLTNVTTVNQLTSDYKLVKAFSTTDLRVAKNYGAYVSYYDLKVCDKDSNQLYGNYSLNPGDEIYIEAKISADTNKHKDFNGVNTIKVNNEDASITKYHKYGYKDDVYAITFRYKLGTVEAPHVHSWTYSADKDKISVYCKSCDDVTPMTITIEAEKDTFACKDDFDADSVTVKKENEISPAPYVVEGPYFYKMFYGNWFFTHSVDGIGEYKAVIKLKNTRDEAYVEFTLDHEYADNCDDDCDACGDERTAPHNYKSDCDEICDCGEERRGNGRHTYTDNCDEECNKCDAVRTAPHEYSSYCDEECNNCDNGDRESNADHYYRNACDDDCDFCGNERTTPHDVSSPCDEKCNARGCGATVTPSADHTFDNECDSECNVCRTTRTVPHVVSSPCDEKCDNERCGARVRPSKEHTYDDTCDTECNECGHTRRIYHTYDNDCDAICNVCEHEREAGHLWSYWVYPYPYNNTLNVRCERFGCSYKGMAITLDAEESYECVGKYNDNFEITDGTYGLVEYKLEFFLVNGPYDWDLVDAVENAGTYTAVISPKYSLNPFERASVVFNIEATHVYTNNCDADCDKCSDTREVEHSFTEKIMSDDTLKTPATCKEEAVYYYTCGVCGVTSENITNTTFEGSVIPCEFTAEVVDYDKYLMEPATCTSLAKLYRSCTMCGASCEDDDNYFEDGQLSGDHVHGSICYYDDEVNAEAHYYPATCGAYHPANWEAHTFEKSVVADEYLVSVADCVTPATYYKSCKCGKAGTETFIDGETTAHPCDETKWASDKENHWHKTICDCEGVSCAHEKEKHTPSEWIIDTPANYGVKGSKHKQCTICATVLETAEIPALIYYDDSDDLYSPPSYKVDVENKDGGSISSDYTYAGNDDKVTITVKPEEGYELDELVILDKNGNKITFTDNGDGTYTFSMPVGGVDVTPTFQEIITEPEEKEVLLVLTIDQVDYELNEQTLQNDVAPIIKDERTMLPIRLVAETLGAEVDWNDAEKFVTIVKGDTVIVIYIGLDYATINGETVELDVPAFIDNSRTYLPVRFISEALGATVDWNNETREVSISVA